MGDRSGTSSMRKKSKWLIRSSSGMFIRLNVGKQLLYSTQNPNNLISRIPLVGFEINQDNMFVRQRDRLIRIRGRLIRNSSKWEFRKARDSVDGWLIAIILPHSVEDSHFGQSDSVCGSIWWYVSNTSCKQTLAYHLKF